MQEKPTKKPTTEPINPAIVIEGAVLQAKNAGESEIELPKEVIDGFWHGTMKGDSFSYKGVTIYVQGTRDKVRDENAQNMEQKIFGQTKV